MDFARKHRARRTVNLTSLIDIIFLLVVFFLLTSKFVVSEAVDLNISTVEGSSEDSGSSNDAIQIVLIEGGKFMYSGKEHPLSSLSEMVGESIAKDKGKPIIIVNKKGASVQNLVTAMDGIKEVGGFNISIVEGST